MTRVSLPVIDADRMLAQLDASIDARVAASVGEHSRWPCRSGCDHCCRSLPHLPRVSESEWARMKEAIDALEPSLKATVVGGLREEQVAPVTCPLLHEGQCSIYEARPIACRSYGFYTERDAGLHCELVLETLAPELDQVVWGNGEALGRELDALGPRRSLQRWLTD